MDEIEETPSVAEQPWQERTLQQAFDLWITPEVKRRAAENKLTLPVDLTKAQVIFREGASPIVRINDEVRVTLLVKTNRAVQAGDPVYESDLGDIQGFELDETDIDAGHFTVLRLSTGWHILFDFAINKGKASSHLTTAEQFLSTSEYALSQNHSGPFVDNLFSCCELISKSRLLLFTPEAELRSHGTVHSRINKWRQLGNVDERFVALFNQLSAARKAARYDAKDTVPTSIPADAVEIARAEIELLRVELKRRGAGL